jgi:hypothetical protein
VKIVGCQKHSRASKYRQRNREILTEDLDMRKVCAKVVPKELTEEEKKKTRAFLVSKQITVLEYPTY